MTNTISNSFDKEWTVYADSSSVADKACELIKNAARIAIRDKGTFKIVLAGGTTPGQVYKALSQEDLDWPNWEFYLGDERCLPIDSSERNSKMANDTLLDHISTPLENIHFIPSELGATEAAMQYAEIIKDKMPFDMVLLGMGEDGHTASLFPGHAHNEAERAHAVSNAPKPPSDRVSLSAASLSNADQVVMIVTGESKQESVHAWKNNEDLPISKITAIKKLTVLLDKAADPDS